MEDNPFVIGVVDDGDPNSTSAQQGGGEEAAAGPVDELIPPTILKELQLQPHLSAAVFGYDIQQMSERPWSKPGANLSDYFNYGFNEKTWRIFCAMQSEGKDSLVQKAEAFYEKIEGIAQRATQQRESAATSLYGNHPQGAHGFNGGSGMPGGPGGFHHQGGPSGGPAGGRAPEAGNYFKTKMCQRFQEGRCTRGSACNFAHGAHELRSSRGFGGGGGGDGGHPDNGGSMQPPRMPYPGPPGADGVLGLPPPPMSGAPSYPIPPPPPMNAYPMMHHPHHQHHGDAFGLAQHPPPHAGFRMAPSKRDRNDDRVFEQGLE